MQTRPDFQNYQFAFTEHIRNPDKQARPKNVVAKGMAVYVEIVFNNMEGSLASCFPVCKRVLGIRRWNKLIRDFFIQHRCQTPLFRQIPEEFLKYLSTERLISPAYLYSLAHYEWVELAMAVSDAEAQFEVVDTQESLLSRTLVLAPALATLKYDYPVQKISPRFKPTTPLDTPVYLLVFRNAADHVEFIELNVVSARLIALIQEGQFTGGEVLLKIAEELQHPNPEMIVQFGTALIADFYQRGVIVGVLPQ